MAVPGERSGPGFTEVGLQSAVPVPGPDSLPRNEWSDWYQPEVYQPAGYQPPEYQPRPYQPPVYQDPAYPQSVYPPPGYPQPGYAQPGAPAPVDEQPFGLRFESPPPAAPPWRRADPFDDDRQSRAPLFWSVVSVVVAVAVVAGVLLLHPFGRNETASSAANSTGTTPAASAAAARSPAASASGSSSPSASASVSAAAVTVRQAASTVAGMLAGSVADRTAIDNAYGDVDGCGPNLDNDAAVFTHAANSRRAMIASLAAMPGRSVLPPALLSELAHAWQASSAADQGLATWAKDEVAQGCVRNDTSDPGYQTTLAPDNEATQDKIAFVAQWNPIAARYGLTAYQSSQL